MDLYNNQTEQNSELNYKGIFRQVLQRWYWYLISIIICLSAALAYLRYTPYVYNVQTTLLIKEDKTKLGSEGFIEGLELLSTSKNVQNEIEIIRSYNNIKKAIEQLHLGVSYFIEGNIKTEELYLDSPFFIKLDTTTTQKYNVHFYVKVLSDSTFMISTHGEKPSDVKHSDICYFGVPCKTKLYSLTLFKTDLFKTSNLNADYFFVIHDVHKLTQAYISKLKVGLVDKKSSVLALSLKGMNPEKEIDFLNTLCEIYIQASLEEKNQIAVNTIRFIDAQLDQITDSLKGAENTLERFRRSEKVMNLSSSAENAFSQLEQFEKEQAELIVKNRYYNYLLEYVNYNNDIKKIIAPSAMGIQDPLLNSLIGSLNDLNLEKASLGFSIKEQNPTSHIIDLKIDNTKKTLVENLKSIIEASKINLQDNAERLARIQEIINKLPANEKDLVNIERKFLLNETIYNYLMQKRIEAGIAKAANTPDHKTINKAMLFGGNPVSPQKSLILMVAFVISLLFPSLLLYIQNSFNDTITQKDTIEKFTAIPILGSIIHNRSRGTLPIIDAPKSGVSESIRSLRINLQYLAVNKKNKVIGVTSSISGEGKTFFSSNLAASIALSGAKTIILGADLRKPRLNKIFELENNIGLSTYYINKSTIDEIIIKTSIANLDIINSGPTPPNPTELIESKATEKLIQTLLDRYEYIIIDAPPVGLVSDYYLLTKHIDANLYIIRQDYTKKDLLKEINHIHKNKVLQNMFLVFNDVNYNSGYGYSYNYSYHGYYENESPGKFSSFINRLKKLAQK